MTLEVYDIQTYQNYIVYMGYRPKGKEWFIYEIGNDYNDLCTHLTETELLMVGFGNMYLGWQILQYLLDGQHMFAKSNGQSICSQVYLKLHSILEEEGDTIPEYQFKIRQIDLYRMWHLYNRSRKATLNDIKFSLRMDNILNNPSSYDKYIEDKEAIKDYVKNNVEAIIKFFNTTVGRDNYPIYSGIDKVGFRNSLYKQFKVSCMNTADAVLGKRMILHLYARATGKPVSEIREMNTHRETVNLAECIPECFKIQSPEFNKVLDEWKQTVIKADTENDVKIQTVFHDTRFTFSLGGVHSVAEPGIYESDDEYAIVDYDVNSLYPSLGKLLKLYPEHLGPIFTKLYTEFVDAKLAEQKKENPDKAKIALLKLMLNAIYGNSNESKSFLYDPLYTYRTTIAGQVFTAMWCELLVRIVPEIEFIAVNTDGICVRLPVRSLDLVVQLNDALYKKFGMMISTDKYQKLIIKDINNYIAIYPDHTAEKEHLKLRGCFDIYPDYYRDTSKRIIPIALKAYFVYNKPIEETIQNHKDIYDFCLKIKSESVTYNKIDHGMITPVPMEHFTRYYIGYGDGTIVKDGKTIIHPGKSCVLFNKFTDDISIDYSYYIAEALKIKNAVIRQQLTLF